MFSGGVMACFAGRFAVRKGDGWRRKTVAIGYAFNVVFL